MSILRGNFEIVGEKFLCDYDGNYDDISRSKSSRTHRKIWDELKSKHNNVSHTYYPRGRVSIYKGVAFIHLNSRCNLPKVVDKIIEEYHLQKLDVEIGLNDTYQVSHYNFELE